MANDPIAALRGLQKLAGILKIVKAMQGINKPVQAGSTQGLGPTGGGTGGGAVSAPVSTLAALPQTPLLKQLVTEGLIKEGMPAEQALAIMAFGKLRGDVPLNIAELMKQVTGDYEKYTGDITTAGQQWMQKTMGAAYDPNDPNARMFANDPLFSTYAGGLAQMDETADTNLATDLAWFRKNQEAEQQYYNEMMAGLSTGTIPVGAAATGGGGGGGGGGRRGGRRGYGGGGGGGGANDSLGFGDINTEMQSDITNQEKLDTLQYENFPGFFRYFQNAILNDPAFADDPQMQQDMQDWLTNILDVNQTPEEVQRALANEQTSLDAAITSNEDLFGPTGSNAMWLQNAPANFQNQLAEWERKTGNIIGDNPATPNVETFYQNPNADQTLITHDPNELAALQQTQEQFIDPTYDATRGTNVNTGLPQQPVASGDIANLMNVFRYMQDSAQTQQSPVDGNTASPPVGGPVGDVMDVLRNVQNQTAAPGLEQGTTEWDDFITRNSVQDAIQATQTPTQGMDWNNALPQSGQWAGPAETAPAGASPEQLGRQSDAAQALIRAARSRVPFENIQGQNSPEWRADYIRSHMGIPLVTPSGELPDYLQGTANAFPTYAQQTAGSQTPPPATINGQPNPAYQEYLTQAMQPTREAIPGEGPQYGTVLGQQVTDTNGEAPGGAMLPVLPDQVQDTASAVSGFAGNSLMPFNRGLLNAFNQIRPMSVDPEQRANIDAAIARLQANMVQNQGYSAPQAAALQNRDPNIEALGENWNYDEWKNQNPDRVVMPEDWNAIWRASAVRNGVLRPDVLQNMKNLSIAANAAARHDFQGTDEEYANWVGKGDFWTPEPSQDEQNRLYAQQFATERILPAVREYNPNVDPAVVYNRIANSTTLKDVLRQKAESFMNALAPLTPTGQRVAAATPQDIGVLQPTNTRPSTSVSEPEYDIEDTFDGGASGLGSTMGANLGTTASLNNLVSRMQALPQPTPQTPNVQQAAQRRIAAPRQAVQGARRLATAAQGAQKLAGLAKLARVLQGFK